MDKSATGHEVFDAETNVSDYLSFTGWETFSTGTSGTLWKNPKSGGELGVPKGLRAGTGLWAGTIDAISYWTREDASAVDKAIRRFWMDVSDFRATSSIVRGNYIAAEAGSALFNGAWKILRSAATTARGSKIAIAGRYSHAGDRTIDGAMFAQTEVGSYILPLLVPIRRRLVDSVQESEGKQLELRSDQAHFAKVMEEPEERRATRTMAQALTAVFHKIIEPAKEPTGAAINEAVLAGASRELVKALHDIVAEETLASFDVKFNWAPRAGKVSGALSSIEIPKDSADILGRAVDKMVPTKEPLNAALNGPIFALYHPKGLDMGEATIEAAYRGRIRRITVVLRGTKELDDAHRWFRGHETLLVEGRVRATADGLRVDAPTSIRPIGETMLFADSAED